MSSVQCGFAAGLGDMPAPMAAYLPRAYQLTITPALTATIVAAEQTFTCTGLSTDDAVFVSPPGVTASLGLASARVTAADTIGITWVNPTAGSLTAPAGVYKVIACKCA